MKTNNDEIFFMITQHLPTTIVTPRSSRKEHECLFYTKLDYRSEVFEFKIEILASVHIK